MDLKDEFFQEPGKLEEAAIAMRDAVHALVREDIRTEIVTLRERNLELETRLKDLDRLEREANNKTAEAQRAIDNAKRDAMKARYEEIVNIFGNTFYIIGWTQAKRPKCGNCDDKRRVTATTIHGQELSGACACDRYEITYAAHEVLMLKILEKSDWRYIKWYADNYGDATFADRCVKEYNGQDFESLGYGDCVFDDIQDATKFVEYLNAREKKN